jgi:hypothetical protein
MKSSRFWFITFVLALFIVSVFPLFSQSTTAGDINGVVTDPSGAVIANAQITARMTARVPLIRRLPTMKVFIGFPCLRQETTR